MDYILLVLEFFPNPPQKRYSKAYFYFDAQISDVGDGT